MPPNASKKHRVKSLSKKQNPFKALKAQQQDSRKLDKKVNPRHGNGSRGSSADATTMDVEGDGSNGKRNNISDFDLKLQQLQARNKGCMKKQHNKGNGGANQEVPVPIKVKSSRPQIVIAPPTFRLSSSASSSSSSSSTQNPSEQQEPPQKANFDFIDELLIAEERDKLNGYLCLLIQLLILILI